MTEEKKLSGQEGMKDNSRHLRGQILEDIRSDKPAVLEETYELLKFHGTYEGYDRDSATARKKQGLDKLYEFMVRLRMPAGRLKPEQYLALDELVGKYANGTMRVTTRETFQFHCITKGNLWNLIHEINEILLSTIAACGDVVRNIITCPAPIKDNRHKVIEEASYALNVATMPNTRGYHEIWVDGEVVAGGKPESEPLYGDTYLPRKFKIAVGFPEDNCMDLLCNDLAFAAMFDGQTLKGYNIYMGGGLGMKHGNAKTYPRIATAVAFIEPEDLIPAAHAIIKLQRDHGDRTDRQHARLKYLMDEKGEKWVRDTLHEYIGKTLPDVLPVEKWGVETHQGWHEQGDGNWFLGVPISSGRIVDRGDEKIRTGLREVVKKYNKDLVLTADQNLIIADITPAEKPEIEKLIRSFGIKLVEDISPVYRDFLACVALPTCGKALAEAERIKLPLVEKIESVMAKYGVADERIAIRMTGCPNGCARPYVGDIGLVGRMPGHYVVYIGGDFEGTRLNTEVLDKVPENDIPVALDPMVALYAANKNKGEGFGDFCLRYGIDKVVANVKQTYAGQYKWAA